MTEEKISNRDIAIMVIVLCVSVIFTQIVMSVISPTSWIPFSIFSMLSGAMFVSIMIGFMIYHQRYRDERTIHVSDKAARNGFAFVLYAIPIAIGGLLGIGASEEALLVLLLLWFGTIAVAGLSAFYYYRK